MRLWHQSLIPYLDKQRLLRQHRELCALRGKGWGKKHSTVDYVFTHEPDYLMAYHLLVMEEMIRRGYNPNGIWFTPNWRGEMIGMDNWIEKIGEEALYFQLCHAANEEGEMIFPEHNDEYFEECLRILREKGVQINFEEY